MREYVLFVDTETSGIPQDWTQPYSVLGNWPHIAQLAWVVYTKAGEEIKAENHYILPSDYDVSPASVSVHGLTREFLQEHGQSRHEVMHRLFQDLLRYEPLVVAHFMKLDFHMLGVGFYRAGLENPLEVLPTFCTMLPTSSFVRNGAQRYLRLGELYERLFKEPLERQHDALVDAQATARCFFELWRQGDVTEKTIAAQAPFRRPTVAAEPSYSAILAGLLLLALLLLGVYFLFL
ncbi:3'-5' exonuclease [Hymenobacter cellulosivorans]|uniref:3'-5' exonuclease n=1 Tax=Hymenobacter cellulosivorans TaxID=2932249 RepID=A0ABY4FFX9_9BACT|nr:3'-5' exonuclease [Hymenobacter cellulosivorans]UOQ54927.1 3'-5' exonuclease [Hymenobacter cellulosivorans]